MLSVEAPERKAVRTAVLIITHNSAEDIDCLLDSLVEVGDPLTIVVDNASADETVSRLSQRRNVRCIEAGGNLGYAGGINKGMLHMPRDCDILLLNPDLTVMPGTIQHMRTALDADPSLGIVVPKILNTDGGLFHSLRREPSLLRMLGDALFGALLRGRPGCLSETVWEERAYSKPHEVDWATGAAMLISARCVNALGDWDERFFLYSEETDYARRAREDGFRIKYVPDARVQHRGGGSGGSDELASLLALNRVRYVRKWRGGPYASLFHALAFLHEVVRIHQPEHRAGARALWRGWVNLPGVGVIARP